MALTKHISHTPDNIKNRDMEARIPNAKLGQGDKSLAMTTPEDRLKMRPDNDT